MKIYILLIFIAFSLFMLNGCFDNELSQKDEISQNNIELGKIVFKNNCASCHGKKGQGIIKNWRVQINGKYPPPPLDGTAHTWHHSPALLLKIINNGGVPNGGSMPAFKNKLNENEKQAVLDYLYSIWPDTVKKIYDSRFKK
jgi:mono/diheme cytochrome c family protein